MRTVILKNEKEFAALVERAAHEWALAKTRAAAPVVGCLSHPLSVHTGQAERRAYNVRNTRAAVLWAAILHRLGVDPLPAIDCSRFITPGSNPGVVRYSVHNRADVIRESVAAAVRTATQKESST